MIRPAKRSVDTVTCGDRLRLPYPLPFYKIKGLLPSVQSRKQALPDLYGVIIQESL